MPDQGDEDEEVLVELEGPPMSKLATAEAFLAALYVGFKAVHKEMEIKVDSPMEEAPQVPMKQPKIQTEVFTTPKEKGKPKNGEVEANLSLKSQRSS